MKHMFFTFLIFISSMAYAQEAVQGSPFSNGILNPEFEGQLTALLGEVIDIKTTSDDKQLYLLNVGIKGVKPIWIAPMVRVASGEIAIGSQLIFRGYIANTAKLNKDLIDIIEVPTLLLAIQIDRAR